ncbi:MAG TPA: response regulator [Hyphomicrobium sp.]|jgi:CheY-like chemotaxis protein|nr:response regulator [Hyphomicrobium sp.]
MARILLADDDAATRDLVKRALEGDGHTVEVTQDGGEALERVKDAGAKGFELLVSDVDMPLLDGIKLAERASSLQPGIRVLLMSGFADQLERAKTLKGPNVAVISKPFTLDQVRATVRKLLG